MEKSKATRADQDQLIQNFITETRELIATTKKDAPLLGELKNLAFDDAALDDGEKRGETAQGAFAIRQQVIGEIDAENAALVAADAVVLRRATDYREIVRLCFKEPAARRALGATDRLPGDKQKLVTLLRASLATAQTAPYAPEMSRRSYDAAGCAAALAEVDALDDAISRRNAAVRKGTLATSERNAAYAALRAWRTDFNRAHKRAAARLGR